MYRPIFLVLVAFVSLLPCAIFADESARIATLEQRIAELEKRVADLEKKRPPDVTPMPSSEQMRAIRSAIFDRRTARDKKKYSKEQLEAAYEIWVGVGSSSDVRRELDIAQTLTEKYPDINYTGIALLLVGKNESYPSTTREKYLIQAIEKHSDCISQDGVSVGAYARFLLAELYIARGEKEKAKTLFMEIIQKYPTAIDTHKLLLAPQAEVNLKDL